MLPTRHLPREASLRRVAVESRLGANPRADCTLHESDRCQSSARCPCIDEQAKNVTSWRQNIMILVQESMDNGVIHTCEA